MNLYQKWVYRLAMCLPILVMLRVALTRSKEFVFHAFYWPAVAEHVGMVYDVAAQQAAMAAHGIYPEWGVLGFVYAPLFAYLFKPLALFAFPTARAVWSVVQLLFYAGALAYLCRRLGLNHWQQSVVFVVMLLSWPMYSSIGYGQSSAYWAVLVFFAVGTRGYVRGLWWGLAVAMKPVAIILGLAWFRQWRALLGATASFLAAAFIAGPRVAADYFRTLLHIVPEAYYHMPTVPSIMGVLSEYGRTGEIAYWFLLPIGLGVSLWAMQRRESPDYQLAIAVVTGLLLAPTLEMHHLAIVAIPLAVAVREWRPILWPGIAAIADALLILHVVFRLIPEETAVLGLGALWLSLVVDVWWDGAKTYILATSAQPDTPMASGVSDSR